MTAAHAPAVVADEVVRHEGWGPVVAAAPQLAVTAWRYVDQMALVRRPATVDATDRALRSLARFLIDTCPDVTGFADVGRGEIEAFNAHFAAAGNNRGRTPARNTTRQQLGLIRCFFDRIIEWDWPDAPPRTPMFSIDVPVASDPLPRFLDDSQSARLLHAASQRPDLLERVVIEVLARTGMRASELCELEADAVVTMSGTTWLRVPVGKLHNDRFIPLHANVVAVLAEWTATHRPAAGRLLSHKGQPLTRHRVSRIVRRVAAAAGLGHVHPHQLRHTLATQAINRGMRLEAIASMLGHRSLRMTLVYARIANRTVADEYAAASARVDELTPGSTTAASTGSLSSIGACSATAGVPDRATATATSKPCARAAATTPPTPRSSPACEPNTTTPHGTDRAPASSSTAGSSNDSSRPREHRSAEPAGLGRSPA